MVGNTVVCGEGHGEEGEGKNGERWAWRDTCSRYCEEFSRGGALSGDITELDGAALTGRRR